MKGTEATTSIKAIGVNAATVALFLIIDTIAPLESWPGIRKIETKWIKKGLAPVSALGITTAIYLWKKDSWYALPLLSGGISSSVILLIRQVSQIVNSEKQKELPSQSEVESYYSNMDGLPEYVIPQLAQKD